MSVIPFSSIDEVVAMSNDNEAGSRRPCGPTT